MSQPDLVTQLRAARTVAPPELRERVRLVAAEAPVRRRRLSWKLGLALAFAAALAVAGAVVATRSRDDGDRGVAVSGVETLPAAAREHAPKAFDTDAKGAPLFAPVATPAAGRVQRYNAYLELRVRDANAVSEAAKRAQRIASSLGGFASSVNVDARGRRGDATIVLRVPRRNVAVAVQRLSALGTITAENVTVQDLEAGLNANARAMERLQKELRELRAQEQTPQVKTKVARLTRQVQALQRANAETVREAHFATIELHLTTKQAAAAKPSAPGPLHGLGVAFRWIGIVAVYVLALGAPFAALAVLVWLAARAVRRRREDALLSTP